jgi:hypothetical protein
MDALAGVNTNENKLIKRYIYNYKYQHACIHTFIHVCIHSYINTYMRMYVQIHVLESLGNLIVAQLLNKFSEFYETQRITAVLAKAPMVPIPSQMNLVYTLPSCSFKTRFNITSHLDLGVQCGLFALGTLISFFVYMCHNTRQFHRP